MSFLKNDCDEEVVMSSSVKTFEAKLDKNWNDQPVKFDYKRNYDFKDLVIEEKCFLRPVLL